MRVWAVVCIAALAFASGPGAAVNDASLSASNQDFASTPWVSLGPSPEGGGIVTNSGQVHAIAADPSNADIVYAGADLGGVWKSMDGGAHWAPLTDGIPSASVGALAIDPSRPSTLYAGFGSQDFERSVDHASVHGAGVWKTTDGGSTWTDVSDPTMLGLRTAAIAVDPADGQHVYVATSAGLFVSADAGHSWTRAFPGYWTGLAIDPLDPTTVLAGGRLDETQGAVIERSNLHGAPGSWTPVSAGLPIGVAPVNPILAVAPGSPSIFYAEFLDRDSAGMYGLYRSVGGTAWQRVAAAPNAPCYASGLCAGYGMFSLAVDPATPATVLLGGIRLYRSTDSGATWHGVCSGAPTCYIHVDQRGLAFGPKGSRRVYAANDGGVFRSDDSGATWRSINAGLRITQFYTIASGPNFALSPFAVGGTQDNGMERYFGSAQWDSPACGDTSDVAIDQADERTVFVTCGWVFKSTDYGLTWSNTTGSLGPDSAAFAHMVMDPSNPSHLIAGGPRIWQTIDAGASWNQVPGLTVSVGGQDRMAMGPGGSALLSAGSSLMYSADGQTWRDIHPVSSSSYPALAIAPSDRSTIYVAAGNQFTGTQLYRTADGGTNWIPVGQLTPSFFVNAIAVDPLDPQVVFAGTLSGMYYSTDGGNSWAPLGAGFPNTIVMALAIDTSRTTLLAATFGRGVYALSLTPTPGPGTTLSLSPSTTVALVGTRVTLTIHFAGGANRHLDVQASALAGAGWQTIASPTADQEGQATIEYTPAADLFYRAIFEGAADLTPTSSVPVRVSVRQTVMLPPLGRTRAGSRIVVAASVLPHGTAVVPEAWFYEYRRVNGSWKFVAKELVSGNPITGQIQFVWRVPASGQWSVRAFATASVLTAASPWSARVTFDASSDDGHCVSPNVRGAVAPMASPRLRIGTKVTTPTGAAAVVSEASPSSR